jgi:hypothetical protein
VLDNLKEGHRPTPGRSAASAAKHQRTESLSSKRCVRISTQREPLLRQKFSHALEVCRCPRASFGARSRHRGRSRCP